MEIKINETLSLVFVIYDVKVPWNTFSKSCFPANIDVTPYVTYFDQAAALARDVA